MNIMELPMEERPLEKMIASGSGSLSNAELLAVIIHTGYGEESAISLSERVICALDGGIRGLMTVNPEELMAIRGIGKAKACALSAVGELSRRISKGSVAEKNYVSSACEAASLFMEDLRFEKKEHFKTLLLDAKGKVIGVEEVSIGGLTMAPVHPREVFVNAIKRSAATVILVHNHPSGDPAPSSEDIVLTERLCQVGKLIGIKIVDHIIIGDGRYYSFAGEGMLKD